MGIYIYLCIFRIFHPTYNYEIEVNSFAALDKKIVCNLSYRGEQKHFMCSRFSHLALPQHAMFSQNYCDLLLNSREPKVLGQSCILMMVLWLQMNIQLL